MQILDLHFRRTFLSPFKSHLHIEGDLIEYNGKTLNLKEVTCINYGILQLYFHGIKSNRIYLIKLETPDHERKLTMQLQAVGLFKKAYLPKENLYLQLVAHLYPTVKRIANDYLMKLQRGETIEIAKVKMNRHGVEMQKGWFKKTKQMIPWKEVKMGVNRGIILLNNKPGKFSKNTRIFRTMDSVVLQCLLEHLWKNGKVLALARGEKIEAI